MNSMTGFGEARREGGRFRMQATARSVNHRNLDVAVRLDDERRGMEQALRQRVGSRFARGRVELAVQVAAMHAPSVRVEISRQVVDALHAASRELAADGLLEGRLTLRDVLAVREAVRVTPSEESWNEADEALLLLVADEALDQLLAARAAEGERLAAVLLDAVGELEGLVGRVAERRREVQGELVAGLRRRLAELAADVEVAPERLAQEAALLAERADVSEELARLGAHLEHFRATAAEEGPLGKRLDFLTQEIFRELNTLGAKSRDAATTRLVVDAKVLCEGLREQVQNVE